MNATNRREFILDYLNEHHSLKINQLVEELDVTRETLRKDLYDLEEEGLIRKTHGGAVLSQKINESAYEKRRNEQSNEKKVIAKLAAEMIENGDTVYLDYGTTIYALAQEIKKMKNITVVTNSIPIITLLMPSEDIEIIVPGGMLRRNEGSLYGDMAYNNLKDIFVTIGFFGCAGISANVGITDHHLGETANSKMMIEHSETSVILSDNSKFGKCAFNRMADFSDIDALVTDQVPPLAEKRELIAQSVELYYPSAAVDEK
ncbi:MULTISPECIES: DeoR/GlpR family DNA-binding transcription regulator [unclassified Enterococcus]|uniref:DeoR/GlpR family DNA-binding transcription regulator n=1 Tax=unclassified Enterococcus TaxID=2608891 RepID=UPI0015529F0C|nr:MULTISPECIES: DeoR/GlpR family DNA-binding transcription regulator [unclassified Enterococcus]MBS7576080.1 DeoR/GlpR transcriptional regulator [Enterococcus sp. MMGLQ5-2]MBS7583313.1 DeoR/GlpR transcriptional regulator [Enterococcus sp. MMGLQ5-1]NPD11173.1 DeoR/GlpR transcriptional regulator [Enterococcus sp. MMGLQ5-1]NPD35916.1 DeoR/GlpR transcriptional regulator [Enterococcus sp. MMGLQ5-2]